MYIYIYRERESVCVRVCVYRCSVILNDEMYESLQHAADWYFNVEMTTYIMLKALLFFCVGLFQC